MLQAQTGTFSVPASGGETESYIINYFITSVSFLSILDTIGADKCRSPLPPAPDT